jgi:hypothetical protein
MRNPVWRALILSLALASLLPAQESVENIVKSAPSRGKFPEATAAVVQSRQAFSLDRAGRKSEDYFLVLEVFNLTGREKFSDFRIPLDKNLEKVDVLLARTYKGNLTAVDVEKGAINDVTPPYLADADMYSNLIHRVLSFPAVDPGSCLAVRYRKESIDAPAQMDGIVRFQLEEPILSKELKVILPAEKSLKYKIIGLNSDFRVETSGPDKIYTLTASDQPQVKPEEYMPPLEEIGSRVVFSTYTDWNEACRGFLRSFDQAVRPTPEIAALAADLTKGAATPDEKVQRLFLFVAKDVRSVKLPFGEGGLEVHQAGVVLKNRYGDWKDKSVLLTALLQAAGLKAFPVLANSQAIPVVEDVPSLKQFDCVLVAVSQGNGLFFLNPFADKSQFGYMSGVDGTRGLLIKPDTAEFCEIRGLSGTESESRNEIVGQLDGRGDLKGKIVSEVTGIFDHWARQSLMDSTAKERRDFFVEALNKLQEDTESGNFKVSDLKDLRTPVKVSQEFLARRFGIFQGKIVLLNVPDLPYEFSGQGLVPRLAKRQYPLRLPDKAAVSLTFRVKIPSGHKLLYIPESFSFRKDYGSFDFSTAFDSGKSELTVKKSYTLTIRDILPGQYEEFKKMMDAFSLPRNTLILLERI